MKHPRITNKTPSLRKFFLSRGRIIYPTQGWQEGKPYAPGKNRAKREKREARAARAKELAAYKKVV